MAKRQGSTRLTKEQQALAADNLNLARNIAWKYHRSTSIDYSVLESAAFEGLCQAAGRYNPELINSDSGKPMRFSSLAVPYIRGSILHYIRDKTYSLKLTHYMRETWVKGRKLLIKGKTDIQIANELGISLSEWQDTRSVCSGPPLELKDQATPTASLEPDEVDRLTPFRGEAAEKIGKLSPASRARLQRFLASKNKAPTNMVVNEIRAMIQG